MNTPPEARAPLRLNIISDGTSIGTKVTLSDGTPVPLVSALNIKVEANQLETRAQVVFACATFELHDVVPEFGAFMRHAIRRMPIDDLRIVHDHIHETMRCIDDERTFTTVEPIIEIVRALKAGVFEEMEGLSPGRKALRAAYRTVIHELLEANGVSKEDLELPEAELFEKLRAYLAEKFPNPFGSLRAEAGAVFGLAAMSGSAAGGISQGAGGPESGGDAQGQA